MDEFDSVLYVSVLLTVSAFIGARLWFLKSERIWIVGCWFAHLVCAFVGAWIHIYYYNGVGDFLGYSMKGAELGAALRLSPSLWEEVAKIITLQDAHLPIEVVGLGTPTAAMSGLTGIVCYLFGGAVYTCCVVFSFFAFVGSACLYVAMAGPERTGISENAMLASCFVPSVVFWSSGPHKECVAFAGLGVSLLGLLLLRRRFSFGNILMVLFGGFFSAISKPYVLIAELLAVIAWAFLEGSSSGLWRTKRSSGQLVVLVGGAVCVLGLAVVGLVSERFSPDRLVDSAVETRIMGSRESGGSTFEVTIIQDRGIVAQATLFPLAIATALFRPMIFEARNSMMLINSLETTWIAWQVLLTVSHLVRRRVSLPSILRKPDLAFSIVFVGLLAVGVGFSVANLGTLSRYRMPLMPFWVFLLLEVRAELVRRRGRVRAAHHSSSTPQFAGRNLRDPDVESAPGKSFS